MINEITFLGYLYVIKCNINNKLYVGITNNMVKRWNKHVYDTGHESQCVIHRAMRKYGIDNFVITELMQCNSKEDLCLLEINFIEKLKSHVSLGGYNETFGGEAPMMGRKHSEESKSKTSNSLKGRPSPNKGKKASEETKQKLREIRGKIVIQYNLDWEIITTYMSASEAGRINNIAASNICGVCCGKKKTAGGYHWRYREGK